MTAKKDRPSVFDESLNLDQFATKAGARTDTPSAALVQKVAFKGGYPSRTAGTAQRIPMTYRSGRTVTFATKTKPETLDDFYRVAHEQGWKVGETFERAVELLAEAHKSGS